MPVYKITSKGFSKGKFSERVEYVDTTKNSIFHTDKTSDQVASTYNKFWGNQAVATKVKRVKISSKGANWGIKIRKLREMV